MSANKRFAIDAVLLVAFVAAYYPLRTGLAVHEWLSLAVIIPSFVHLVINWDWVQRVFTSFLGRVRTMSRVNLVVDSALFLSTVTVMLSGFVVSRVISGLLGYEASLFPVWHRVHALSADAVVLLMLVHLGLHWKWVVRVARTRVFVGGSLSFEDDEPVLIPVPVSRDGWDYARRDRVPYPLYGQVVGGRQALSGTVVPDRVAPFFGSAEPTDPFAREPRRERGDRV